MSDVEPTYEYIKGQGWVASFTNDEFRIFQWKGKWWRHD